MERYRETFDNLYPKSKLKQFAYYIFAGIVYFAIGVASYYRNSDDLLMVTIWFLFSIVYIIIAFYQKYRNEKYFVEFNDNGIDTKLSAFKSINIKWNEIKEIEIKPLSIVFKLESYLKDEELSLSAYSYGSVRKFKSKLNKFANEKGIEIK